MLCRSVRNPHRQCRKVYAAEHHRRSKWRSRIRGEGASRWDLTGNRALIVGIEATFHRYGIAEAMAREGAEIAFTTE